MPTYIYSFLELHRSLEMFLTVYAQNKNQNSLNKEKMIQWLYQPTTINYFINELNINLMVGKRYLNFSKAFFITCLINCYF